ncbi:hypothetical protein SynROS8604_01948 [Synechococcus sp. ROS8604]|nr:hypothetical protein SynROS8604_01948 [Synechococcus sp. ROS8604]
MLLICQTLQPKLPKTHCGQPNRTPTKPKMRHELKLVTSSLEKQTCLRAFTCKESGVSIGIL